MNRFKMIAMCLLAIIAACLNVKAQEVTITLEPGWNWISIPLMDTLDFETAMGSVTPIVGDIIKSRWGSATYTSDGQWRGSISQFYPGYGYHYKSNRTMPVMVTFNAQQPAPQVIVTTIDPTDITTNSATCGGSVTSGDGDFVFVFLRGICWSTNSNPTFNDNYIDVGNGIGSFSVSMTELTPNTTYYIRAFAVTVDGTFYGEEMSFATDYDYVDLGLPSGTLWATCNVGADSPWDYGDYFAWGETEAKSTYNWSTYQHCNGSPNTLTKYCNNSSFGYNGYTDNLSTLRLVDDAATANWGISWRMPSKEEWQELYQNTTCSWTTQNGVNGRLFIASNGNSLFLPAAGYYNESTFYPGVGLYWSSFLHPVYPANALRFTVISGSNELDYLSRSYGLPVRPVRNTVQNNAPTGAVDGFFSVSATRQVYFSKGNLQYQASTNTWRFAENQWDYVGTQTPTYGNPGGTVSGSDNCFISQNYSGWIDLFGWGTSRYHNSNDPYNVNYQPWSTSSSTVSLDYNNSGYGPSTNMASPNLTGSSENYDWGVYNPISNGGNTTGQWRTLTRSEWNYVFNTRITASGIRYVKANVNGVNGVILLPDDWSNSFYVLNDANGGNYCSNNLTASQWNILEQTGAVFLPAAGSRSETSVGNTGTSGYYWHATYSNSCFSYTIGFNDNIIDANCISVRYRGQSVRLVQDTE